MAGAGADEVNGALLGVGRRGRRADEEGVGDGWVGRGSRNGRGG